MTASSLTHYWAFEIVAMTHFSILEKAITTAKWDSPPASFHGFDTLSESDNENLVAASAEMICNSMAYLLQPEMRLSGPGSAFFTLPTAIRVFQSKPDRYSVQLSRCQQITERLATMQIHFRRI
jgi:hypothetical protein